jgi:ribulose-5-phosphate 4-epimerase/fuculose-1-phosphate aldolase
VILRHHGIHVWGENWKKAKLMAEAYHYLIDMAVEMHKLGINEYTNC